MAIFKDLREVVPRACENALALLEGLLDINTQNRFSASESLRKSWFQTAATPVVAPSDPPPANPPTTAANPSSNASNPSRSHRRPSQDAYDSESLTKRTRPN